MGKYAVAHALNSKDVVVKPVALTSKATAEPKFDFEVDVQPQALQDELKAAFSDISVTKVPDFLTALLSADSNRMRVNVTDGLLPAICFPVLRLIVALSSTCCSMFRNQQCILRCQCNVAMGGTSHL